MLTDASLIAVSNNCHKLKKVDIRCAKLTTDKGILALVSNNHDLEVIFILESRLLTDASLITIGTHCHRLRKILFQQIRLLTDRGIAALVDNKHDLISVALDGCDYLTDISLMAIATNCTKLKTFIFGDAKLVTEDGITVVVSSNPDLESLSVSWCRKFNETSLPNTCLMSFAEHCHRLRTLSLNHMKHFTDQGVMALVCNNRDLKNIDLDGCLHLTNVCLEAIGNNCHELKILSCNFILADIQSGLKYVKKKCRQLINCRSDSDRWY